MTEISRKKKKQFIDTCVTTFESFKYSCEHNKGIGSVWEMMATNFGGDRSYAIICAPRVDEFRNQIRIAKKRLGDEARLVVVTEQHCEVEESLSIENDYSLVTLDLMKDFGLQMLEIEKRDREQGKEVSEEELAALMSSREKVF
ncbi:MAG: hypothetical protein ACJAT2_000719 [Bacteriovoracaceae bacterium]|jgi:hypothetical protein